MLPRAKGRKRHHTGRTLAGVAILRMLPWPDFATRVPPEGKTLAQVASLFNQLLQQFPRGEFAGLVKKQSAERAAKGFTCWMQFVSMLFCQLGRADSLREICNGLASCLVASEPARPAPGKRTECLTDFIESAGRAILRWDLE